MMPTSSSPSARGAAATSPALAPGLNVDLNWEVYADDALAAAAVEAFENAKNVAYWSQTGRREKDRATGNPLPGARICDAFYEGNAWKVRLAAGTVLYKFNSYESLTAPGSTAVRPWWSPYHEYDVAPRFVERLKLCVQLGGDLQELGRVTSCIVTEWNTLAYVAVIKLKVDVYAWYGGFASMPRFDRDMPAKPAVPFDPTSGVRLFTDAEKVALVRACARAAGAPVAAGELSDWVRGKYLERWDALTKSGVNPALLPALADLGTFKSGRATPPATPPATLPSPPAPAAPAQASLGGKPPPRAPRQKRLPGGSRQFFIPNLSTTQAELVHIRDIRNFNKSVDPERWWAQGHDGADTTKKPLSGALTPPG